MKKQIFFMFLAFFVVLWKESDGSRILFLAPVGSKSHKIFFMGISKALADRGHHVTMLSPYESSKKFKNIREIAIPEADLSPTLKNIFEESGRIKRAIKLLSGMPSHCIQAFSLKNVQDLKKEKFDLIILTLFFEYCFLSLVHHFQVPFIYATPSGLFEPFQSIIGSIEFPSLVPNKLSDALFPQTFQQRFTSVVANTMFILTTSHYLEPSMEKMCKKLDLCPPDMPSLSKINKNVSLAIINSVKSMEWPPRPTMPNVIHAGGIHIQPAKNLSQDLESWATASGDEGFIFFSLGSAVTPSYMPERYRKVFIKVFSSLKQQVLWKWDDESMPDLPKNVKLGKWFPQQDILAHSKLKVFITHGGRLSTMEATYHGIPVIGLPVFSDQFSNMNEAAKEGWANVVHWNQLTVTHLRETILQTINNGTLKEVSLRRSALMRDLPIKPAEEAAFWVEYVLRHNGAPHLMSPISRMSWREVYNMDIWTIIVGLSVCLLYVFLRILKSLLYLCFGKKKEKKCKGE